MKIEEDIEGRTEIQFVQISTTESTVSFKEGSPHHSHFIPVQLDDCQREGLSHNQIPLGENSSTSQPTTPSRPTFSTVIAIISVVKRWIVDNFLIFCFAVALTIAMTAPEPGIEANRARIGSETFSIVSFFNTCVVFFLSGLALQVKDLQSILRDYKLICWGLLCINFITTLMALFFLNLSFMKTGYKKGFAIFNTVPTTLGVGVALTQLAQGDAILSLTMTVISNMLGTITVPFLLTFYFSHAPSSSDEKDQNIEVDTEELIVNLILSVLIPTILGITVRNLLSDQHSQLIKKYKVELSMTSSVNLACIVWMAISSSQSVLLRQSVGDILVVLAFAASTHIFSLAFHHFLNSFLSKHSGYLRRFGLVEMSLSQVISLTIMASQKSSPVALAVISGMGVESDVRGLYTIPCVIGQLCQIFIGSVVARYYSKRREAEIAEERGQYVVQDELDVEVGELTGEEEEEEVDDFGSGQQEITLGIAQEKEVEEEPDGSHKSQECLILHHAAVPTVL
eukprot:gene8607-9486_t